MCQVVRPGRVDGDAVTMLLSAVSSGAPLLDVVHHCDALTLLRALPDASIDMILTSPPYDNLRQYKGYSWNFEAIAHQMYRVLKPGGVAVWVVGDSVVDGSETLTSLKQALYFKEQAGFRLHDTMIWQKSALPGLVGSRYEQTFEYMFIFSKDAPLIFNPLTEKTIRPGKSNGHKGSRGPDGWKTIEGTKRYTAERKLLSNIWYIPNGYMLTTTDVEMFGKHSAMFPEELARRHIATWSNPGDTVLDFFMGSGTTAKVARNLGRHYIGCDISAEYVSLARKRLQDTDPYQDTQIAPGVVQHSLFGGAA